MSNDQRSPAEPNKIPLFIGAGVEFSGAIRHAGAQDEKAVILGQFTGDVEWNGILQVPRGGKVIVEKSMRCREMLIAGEIVGASDEVVIETGLLRLADSASVDVATVSVPPGGLEQSRGSVVNATLRMSKKNAYAQEGSAPVAAPAAQPPRLILAASAPAGAPAADSSADRSSDETRTAQSGPSAAYGS